MSTDLTISQGPKEALTTAVTDLVDEWLRYCRDADDASPATLQPYPRAKLDSPQHRISALAATQQPSPSCLARAVLCPYGHWGLSDADSPVAAEFW